MRRPDVVLIAAMDRNRVIGKDNQLPWRLSDDLKAFKKRTLGSPVLMGRKTWESIGRPLPGRLNLVMTRKADYQAEGAQVVHSVEEARRQVTGQGMLYVIGGEEIYALFLPEADRLVLTHVDTDVEGGDARFPEWDAGAFRVVSDQGVAADERNEHAFRIVEYAKKDPNC